MSVAANPRTWDDIKDWPEDAGYKTELVHGEVVVSPTPYPEHAWISNEIGYALNQFVRREDLGQVYSTPVDVILGTQVVYQPDLCFIRKERLQIIEKQILGPPDLCIEVISEANRTHDTNVKFTDYARYGVAEYWLVDPRERSISTWRNADGRFELIGRAGGGERVASVVLPGIELDAGAAFPPER